MSQQNQKNQKSNGFAAIEMLMVLLTLAIIGVAGYIVAKNVDNKKPAAAKPPVSTPAKSTTTPGYLTADTQFLTAMASQNKAGADALETPAFQQFVKAQSGTTSFYSACTAAGVLCTYEFLPANLEKATTAVSPYTAKNGVKGEQELITVKQATSSDSATTSSSYSFKLDAVHSGSGSTWLIDLVDQTGTTSFSATVN